MFKLNVAFMRLRYQTNIAFVKSSYVCLNAVFAMVWVELWLLSPKKNSSKDRISNNLSTYDRLVFCPWALIISLATFQDQLDFLMSPYVLQLLRSWLKPSTASIADLECFNSVIRYFKGQGHMLEACLLGVDLMWRQFERCQFQGHPEGFNITAAKGTLLEPLDLFNNCCL